MNDRETRRYDMFGRVQTFGLDRAADFAAGSKAKGHFTALTQIIQDLAVERAKQSGGRATAKEVLVEALRLDLRDITRTARAIDREEPGFADKFRAPVSDNPRAVLTAAAAMLQELEKPGVPAKFIAYELPADFVQDLKDDLAAIAAADTAMESDDQEGVASTAGVGRLIKAGTGEVAHLDAIIRNKYSRKVEPLRAWESASHVERAPKREKAPGGGPAPVVPPV
jgi:hypothetical protein